jgi:DNA-binding transcriptional ArsR family regulator
VLSSVRSSGDPAAMISALESWAGEKTGEPAHEPTRSPLQHRTTAARRATIHRREASLVPTAASEGALDRGDDHYDSIANWLHSHVAMDTDARLSLLFSALSDSTRRAMLARLAQGEATVAELADPFGMAQPTISKHLRVLEDAGLIRTARDAQRRPRSLVIGGPLEEVEAWLAPFRAQWERRLDRLESFLGSRAKPSKKNRTPRSKTNKPTKKETT